MPDLPGVVRCGSSCLVSADYSCVSLKSLSASAAERCVATSRMRRARVWSESSSRISKGRCGSAVAFLAWIRPPSSGGGLRLVLMILGVQALPALGLADLVGHSHDAARDGEGTLRCADDAASEMRVPKYAHGGPPTRIAVAVDPGTDWTPEARICGSPMLKETRSRARRRCPVEAAIARRDARSVRRRAGAGRWCRRPRRRDARCTPFGRCIGEHRQIWQWPR